MIYDHNLDDYGWYEVGTHRFYNKIEAVLAHKQLNLPIRWNYNDAEYDAWDWTREPDRNLEDLYAERAWDIRNRYDYLVLHFSGGSDSANVLETFIRNKIPLDEILTRGSISQSSGRKGIVPATDIYSECLNQALPLAQWAKENHYPNLKISVIDTTQIILDYFKSNPTWFEQGVIGLTPGLIIKQNVDLLSPHYRELAEKGVKVAHIYGVDKPLVYQKDGVYYTQWRDGLLGEFSSPRTAGNHLPQYIELFYRGRRSIEMQLKQLHIVKRCLKINNHTINPFDQRDYDKYVARLIYNRTLPLWCEHLKRDSDTAVQDKDAWFARRTNHDSYEIWERGVDYIRSQMPKHFLDGEKIVMISSKPRFLGR